MVGSHKKRGVENKKTIDFLLYNYYIVIEFDSFRITKNKCQLTGSE